MLYVVLVDRPHSHDHTLRQVSVFTMNKAALTPLVEFTAGSENPELLDQLKTAVASSVALNKNQDASTATESSIETELIMADMLQRLETKSAALKSIVVSD